jgi:predicted ATP-grasp superfamily ATP-dependent carboligase
MSIKKKAVVSDGQWRKSISVIRSIGKKGYDVIVLGDSFFTTGFWSRFTKKRVKICSSSDNRDLFGKRLPEILQEFKTEKPVFFPMEDSTLMWLSENRKAVSSLCDFIIPSAASLQIAQDKSKTVKIAEKMRIPCPLTIEPKNEKAFLKALKKNKLKHFIIKPCSGTGSSGIKYDPVLTDKEALDHWMQYGKSLIQERIPAEGRGIGVGILMDKKHRCVAYFVHERLRQYPVSGGPSTDRRGIEYPELVEKSIKLLKHLSWTGIAMVEWKEDPTDGIPKIMEINPRFWGSLELAVRSGVDFPYLYAELSSGRQVAPVKEYKSGIRCRWMIPGDILRYLSEPKKTKESFLNFLKGLPSSAEEWDRHDLLGSIACIICPALLVLNPKYWKYLKRK